MSLIKCPECQKEVSDKSEKCIHCGFPLNKHSAISPSYKINKWQCKVCGNMIDHTPCPYCANSSENNPKSNSTGFKIMQPNIEINKSPKMNLRTLIEMTIMIVVAIISIPLLFTIISLSTPKTYYYVAEMPGYSATALKVDGYIHRDKSCCEKVANHFGATVIKVKAEQEAEKNSYGQTIRYKDAFDYCPLCCR